LNFYYVTDPAMIRLIHRAVPLSQFIKDRWIPCPHCGADNLMNIELVPERNDPLCHECGRKLL
jgi:transposase-like protein